MLFVLVDNTFIGCSKTLNKSGWNLLAKFYCRPEVQNELRTPNDCRIASTRHNIFVSTIQCVNWTWTSCINDKWRSAQSQGVREKIWMIKVCVSVGRIIRQNVKVRQSCESELFSHPMRDKPSFVGIWYK